MVKKGNARKKTFFFSGGVPSSVGCSKHSVFVFVSIFVCDIVIAR